MSRRDVGDIAAIAGSIAFLTAVAFILLLLVFP